MRSPRAAVKSSPHWLQLEKAYGQQRRPNAAKNKQINKFIKKRNFQLIPWEIAHCLGILPPPLLSPVSVLVRGDSTDPGVRYLEGT